MTGLNRFVRRKRAKESKETKEDDKEEERNSPDYKWTISALKPEKLTFDPNPHSFFTCSSHLRVLYDEVLMKFARSLRNYKYINVTHHVTAVFGPMFVGVQGSGIDSLFPVRGPGRPPKRLREQDNSDAIKQPIVRPLRLLSSDYPDIPIAHVHLIAKDITDEQLYVFVEWGPEAWHASSWIPFSTLTPSTRDWCVGNGKSGFHV